MTEDEAKNLFQICFGTHDKGLAAIQQAHEIASYSAELIQLIFSCKAKYPPKIRIIVFIQFFNRNKKQYKNGINNLCTQCKFRLSSNYKLINIQYNILVDSQKNYILRDTYNDFYQFIYNIKFFINYVQKLYYKKLY